MWPQELKHLKGTSGLAQTRLKRHGRDKHSSLPISNKEKKVFKIDTRGRSEKNVAGASTDMCACLSPAIHIKLFPP